MNLIYEDHVLKGHVMDKYARKISIAACAVAAAFSPAFAASETSRQFAMMDMMPMPAQTPMAGAAQPAAPGTGAMPGMAMPGGQPAVAAPATGGMTRRGMDDDKMPMEGRMPAAGASPMPTGQMAQPAQPAMGQCPMMSMMQTMMRPGGAQPGMGAMTGNAAPTTSMAGGATPGNMEQQGSSAARLEGRIAFLRTELRITDTQMANWETFATALRAGREHLDAARSALQNSGSAAEPMARLESYESHLKERLEAMHSTRMAFGALFGQFDDAQKRMATSMMLPFIGAF